VEVGGGGVVRWDNVVDESINSESLKGRENFQDISAESTIILKWIFKKYFGRMCTRLIWLRTRTVVGSCEHDNKLSGSIKN
jgi:hypothetical protein